MGDVIQTNKRTMDLINLETSLVITSVCNNGYCPILKQIPTGEISGQHPTYTAERLDYYPINKTGVDRIHFKLKFAYGDGKTVRLVTRNKPPISLSLHFRRKTRLNETMV